LPASLPRPKKGLKWVCQGMEAKTQSKTDKEGTREKGRWRVAKEEAFTVS